MSMCLMCQNGYPASCQQIGLCESRKSLGTESGPSLTDQENNDEDSSTLGKESRQSRGRTVSSRNARPKNARVQPSKRDANLKDQQSTGRKRAARLYPMDANGPCEWSYKNRCGGGDYPILGCLTGKQQARHHGPDKSVVNNEVGNVHRICDYCHARWHMLNDEGYNWNITNHPSHNPIPMTIEDQQTAALDEMRYLGTWRNRAKIKD